MPLGRAEGLPFDGNPRLAADPINAILNYLYAVLEAEARLALAAVGLDAGLGVIHVDQRVRDSLALDLMEPVRPAVDAYVLRLIATRPLALRDFHEARNGHCRLMPRLAAELAETAITWGTHVAPHAELIARLLSDDAGLPRPATRLTGAARRHARPAGQKTRAPRPELPAIRSSACIECGATTPQRQKRCATCHRAFNERRLAQHQVEEVERRRRSGTHPSQELAVRRRIGARQQEHWQARQLADAPTGYSGSTAEFRRLILTSITDVPPSTLARATGLSAGYCAQIQAGKRVPHVRHWAALQLVGLRH